MRVHKNFAPANLLPLHENLEQEFKKMQRAVSEHVSISPLGSILLNIHEVWPCPFWGGSSHQKKTLWIISLVIFLLLHWKVIRGQIK